MKLSKQEKAIAKITEMMFYKLANGIQFNIMDLGKIDKGAKVVLLAGGALEDAEAAMLEAIAQYRVN